jgi:hypothetical protein
MSEEKSIIIDQTLPTAYEVGEQYLFMTVTTYFTGKVKQIIGKDIVLTESAWIPDIGRFATNLESGSLDEVEPIKIGVNIINRDAIVNAIVWTHQLPNKQK